MRSGVLFVEDEDLLRTMYESLSDALQNHYSIFTASDGEQALKVLQKRHIDVVVTDLTMPGMDGFKFLAHVVKAQPDAARIIISGYADRLKVARCLFVGHRYFPKPCDLNALGALLLRLASFREIISNDRVRRLIGGIGSLPGPPETFLKLQKLMESSTSSLDDVGKLLEQDPAVTAKLLQLVNSAQFGLPQKIISATEAVQLLGLGAVSGLLLGLQAFTAYNGQPGKNAPPAELWDHSLRVACAARNIARAQSFGLQSRERAFLAGLLHDVGRIVIHANAADEFAEVVKSAERFRIPITEAESRRFGATYAEIGAYLLALWGIDEEVTSIVQYQDRLASFPGKDPAALAAMHVAHCAEVANPAAAPLDIQALTAFGFPDAEQWAA
jgi:HD-like signal output (HDOD) protein/ActR/RegA family two-component response regulator